MKLENIYRGDIIQCNGFDGDNAVIHSDSCGRKYYRYGKFDRIYRSNTVLIDVGNGLYIDLVSASIGMNFNFDNIEMYAIPTYATGENCFYVDKGSLKPYVYNEMNQDVKKNSK